MKHAIECGCTAFTRFFKHQSGFPNFKKKDISDVKMYFVKNNPKDCFCERHRIHIPTLGWVRLKEKGFDYTVRNFHSAPDTAFCYHGMDKTYRLMKKFEKDVDTASLQEKYLAIMKKAAAAIRDGGFHTPNHRWAICAALMQAADVFAADEAFAASCKARTAKYFNLWSMLWRA